jgi:hypothetical protein
MMTGNIIVTFILAIANSEQIIQISDCSVVLNGRIEDEKFNKAGHLLCDDASVLYGFTGLATVDNHENIQHDVQDWILDALDIAVARAFESSGQTGYFIGEIEAEFAYLALQTRHVLGRDKGGRSTPDLHAHRLQERWNPDPHDHFQLSGPDLSPGGIQDCYSHT